MVAADPDLQTGRGGCHPDPEITGGPVSKNFFRPFGPPFGVKKGGAGPSPGSATDLYLSYS